MDIAKQMSGLEKALSAAKDMLTSRTVWGGIILVMNSFFASKVDMASVQQLPAALGGAIDGMQAAMTAIGAALVLIGRAFAKPTALVK